MSETVVERGAGAAADAIVVDTAAPTSAPGGFSAAIVARLREKARAGATGGQLIAALEALVHDTLGEDDLPEFWSAWSAADVDVASVTVGVFGAEPFSHANAVRDLARWNRTFDRRPELMRITSRADAVAAKRAGRRGVLLHFANTIAIGEDLDELARFRDGGVHAMQLTYNTRNLVGDGCSEASDAGLSPFGRDVVRAMNELGILVDLAHAGTQTTLDAIEASGRPCAVTHSVCRALVGHERASEDAVLRALGASGGYFGVLVTPFTITQDGDADLEHWLRHVEHAIAMAGIENVGIGTDWGVVFPDFMTERLNDEINRPGFRPSVAVDWGAHLDGFSSWSEWPQLPATLRAAGFSEPEVRGLVGGNFLRVFGQVSP